MIKIKIKIKMGHMVAIWTGDDLATFFGNFTLAFFVAGSDHLGNYNF